MYKNNATYDNNTSPKRDCSNVQITQLSCERQKTKNVYKNNTNCANWNQGRWVGDQEHMVGKAPTEVNLYTERVDQNEITQTTGIFRSFKNCMEETGVHFLPVYQP